jgi:hypothetical protein
MPPEKNTQPSKVQETPPSPKAVLMTDAQVERLERATIIAGVISGLLASGRMPSSKENKAYFDGALTVALEALNR